MSKKIKYHFVNKYNNKEQLFKTLKPIEIYQIAIYSKNSFNMNTVNSNLVTNNVDDSEKIYEIRIIYINELNNIYNVITKFLTNKQYKYLLKNIPNNKYKRFAVYDLKQIPLPSVDDIMRARSLYTL